MLPIPPPFTVHSVHRHIEHMSVVGFRPVVPSTVRRTRRRVINTDFPYAHSSGTAHRSSTREAAAARITTRRLTSDNQKRQATTLLHCACLKVCSESKQNYLETTSEYILVHIPRRLDSIYRLFNTRFGVVFPKLS